MGIRQQFSGLLAVGAGRQEPEPEACRLSSDRRVGVQHRLELVVDLGVPRAESAQAEPQARAMLHDLGVLLLPTRGAPERLEQKVPHGGPLLGVDEAQSVQRAALRVRAAAAGPLGHVRGHQGPALAEMPLVDHTEPCSGAELGPVGRARQPVQVLAQKSVDSRASVHQRIGTDSGPVAHAVAALDAGLDVLQDLQVGVVVVVQELQVELDGEVSQQNGPKLRLVRRQRPSRRGGGGGGGPAIRLHGPLLRRGCGRGCLPFSERLGNRGEKALVAVLEEVKADLESGEPLLVPPFQQLVQDVCQLLTVLQRGEALALAEPFPLLRGLHEPHEHREHLLPVLGARQVLLGDTQGVPQGLGRVRRLLHRLFHQVQPLRIQGHPHRLLRLLVAEAPREHALHHALHPPIDLSLRPFLVAQADVLVQALPEQRAAEVGLAVDVEGLPGAQRVVQAVPQLPEVVEHLGG
mmetsp:Transcript_19466/g.54719  ORF Transcript_19466/g.54719 Transcript_19466/m.54719 type:complete len:464 (-) Transcript_19466:231-1622(-)